MLSLAPLLAVAAAGVASVAAYPQPLNLTGDYGLVHDPSLTRRGTDGKYFLFCTGDNGPIRTSDDLIHWTLEGTVFPDGNPSETVQYTLNYTSLWAPDVTWIDEIVGFRNYFSASSFGSQNSGIFLAESPTGENGTWTHKGLVVATTNASDWNAIDANLFIDDDGRQYLTAGSWWHGIQLFEVDPETGFIADNSTRTNIAKRPVGTAAEEAPFLIKKDGFYWLFTAFDVCCAGLSSTYNIRVSRSTSIYGPYIDQSGGLAIDGGGNVLLAGHGSIVGPGGQSIYQENGNTILVYHSYLADGSSNLNLNYLDFSSGWPVVV